MISVLFVFGLVAAVWAWDYLRSTFKAGPRSWKGFCENWRDSGRMETDGTAAAKAGVIHWPGEYWAMELTLWQRLQYSLRAMPQSQFSGPPRECGERIKQMRFHVNAAAALVVSGFILLGLDVARDAGIAFLIAGVAIYVGVVIGDKKHDVVGRSQSDARDLPTEAKE